MRTLHREAGLDFPSSEIIHGGVPIDQFYKPIDFRSNESDKLRLLYVGQVSPDRGLHTVIDALGKMHPSSRSKITLTVVGNGPSAYFAQVNAQREQLNLTACVDFRGMLPHDQMPDVYRQHDLLVFPSIRAEGLPLTMVEAMLAGCAVITTGSGGAMEVAAPAALPLFPKNDATLLSELLTRLVADRRQVAEIALRGQQVALREFSFDRMMDRFQATLRRLHESTADLTPCDGGGRHHDATVSRT
jgi:glycosyltransferase involved in cell wall biosynthesis